MMCMAKDIYHDAVKRALERGGWKITHDPLHLVSLGFNVLIDLGAEQLLGATRNGQKIAVEIKSFVTSSGVSQFHMALGQFFNYRDVLTDIDPQRKLYLAIPEDAYETTFMIPFVQRAVQKYEIAYLIYHPFEEVILSWHE